MDFRAKGAAKKTLGGGGYTKEDQGKERGRILYSGEKKNASLLSGLIDFRTSGNLFLRMQVQRGEAAARRSQPEKKKRWEGEGLAGGRSDLWGGEVPILGMPVEGRSFSKEKVCAKQRVGEGGR